MSTVYINKETYNEIDINGTIPISIGAPCIKQLEGQQAFLMFPIGEVVAAELKKFGIPTEVYIENVDVHKRIAMLESYIKELAMRIDRIPINRDNYPG